MHAQPLRLDAATFQCRLRQQLRTMSQATLLAELYRDPLTGLYNRRAFAEATSAWFAIVDADSLKWVNDNEGHEAGDALLCRMADALTVEFGRANVFRLGGDEFVVCGDCPAKLARGFERVRRLMFAGFSFGRGRTLAEADDELRADKRRRTASGLRAERGRTPVAASV